MLNSNLFKGAHNMAREIKAEYKNVDYKFQFGLCLSYLSKIEGEIKMDLRVKRMEISKNLLSLRSWAISDLAETETISFFLEEDCEEEFKITVSKEGLNFIVKLGTEVFGKQHDFELFDGFAEMFEVESIKEIPVFKAELNEVA